MVWLVILIVWLIGILVAYNFTKKWDNKSKFEKIYFAIIWPILLPLYVIHFLHNLG